MELPAPDRPENQNRGRKEAPGKPVCGHAPPGVEGDVRSPLPSDAGRLLRSRPRLFKV
jgi:hypothetical protein